MKKLAMMFKNVSLSVRSTDIVLHFTPKIDDTTITLLGKNETRKTATVSTIVEIPSHLTDLLCREAALLAVTSIRIDVTISVVYRRMQPNMKAIPDNHAGTMDRDES
jgi:hypothetical protein